MSPSSSPTRGRSALIWIIKIVVSGGLLYWLLARVDLQRLWTIARTASPLWLVTALVLYFLMIVVSTWRWELLTRAQHLDFSFGWLLNSFLVATFFNNFLPSNIGGDVVRITDTSKRAGSKTLATTIVLVDRGIGLLGLVFVAAVGASLAARRSGAIGPLGPGLLWLILAGAIAIAATVLLLPHRLGQMLGPLRALHQEWVDERIARLTTGLARFRQNPRALVACFLGAIVVQAIIVAFYAAIATAIRVPMPLAHLAIMVPVSFIVQMAPISVNGIGVRETTFGVYFAQLGLPLESALALSFIGLALIMLVSISGAVVYLSRAESRAA